MNTAGAALRIRQLSTILVMTIMSHLADTIPATFEQHLKESVHRFVGFACRRVSRATSRVFILQKSHPDGSP